jgi:serine/threonine protein kinase
VRALHRRPGSDERGSAWIGAAWAGAPEPDSAGTFAGRGRGDSTVAVSAAPAGTGSGAAAGSEHSLAIGERVGQRYRILRFIARGAVGEVYAAFDEELGVTVALKSLRSERAEDGLTLARFRREVLLTRGLAHPGICRVFDLGVHEAKGGGRLPFLTMELIAGETLADRLRARGSLGPDAALALAEKLASALAAAHAAGVIHRDLKPANIMLAADESAAGGERVIITDFGLARRARVTGGGGRVGTGDVCQDSGDGWDVHATATGALVGSPAYMAPEQVAGLEVGTAADIYSLGVVLFEAVTGRLPFLDESLLAMIASRLERDAPAARSVCPELDPRWDEALARCLRRDPAARFARVDDLPRALTAPIALAPRPRWRRRIAAAAGLATHLAGALLLAPVRRG